jgi:hypothetical protein
MALPADPAGYRARLGEFLDALSAQSGDLAYSADAR